MNDEFEQEIIDDEISGDEPLISHNHSNQNNYRNQRNNNQRKVRGNNLSQRRRNTGNNNPITKNSAGGVSRTNGGVNLSKNNGASNGSNLSKPIGGNRNRNNRRNNRTNSSSSNVTFENSSNNNKTQNFLNDFSTSSIDETEDKIKIKVPLILKIKVVLGIGALIVGILIILFICAIFIVLFGGGLSTTQNINTDENSSSKNYCKEFEVTFYKKIEENGSTEYVINEEVGENGVATYDLETYIAGVVTGEVGIFDNEEILKALAVAARTFALARTAGSDCKVNSWDKFQVMSPSISAKGRKAAKDTEGEVLYGINNNLIVSEYDAFACYEKDEENYYLKQGNIIPKKWVEDNFPKLNSKWTSCTMQNAHGRGMSQYGGLYLAEVHGYTYHEILNYYYGDQIQGFYCTYEEVEGSCDPNDVDCEPEYEKVCE